MSPNRIYLPLSQLLQLPQLLLLLGCLVASTRGTCNVCNTVNNLTCYSSTQMQACQPDVLSTATPTDCPSGYVCVSGSSGVLCEPQDSASGSQADCQECNTCDSTQTFACTGTQSFALCLGTPTVQDSVGTCASGYVCNINDTQICGLPADGVMATCSYADDTTTSTTTTSTTAATPSTGSASTYCAAVQSQGKYAVGYNADTTCRQYIYCTLVGGSWVGQTYTCPGAMYFNSSSKMCVTSMPSTCSTSAPTPATTTVAPTTSNPAAYCQAMQSEGYYPVGTDASTTCRQYIYCFLNGGSWSGNMYTCAGNLYYNSASKICVSSLPSTCSTTVASLTLNGVVLD
ncbi:nuclear pore complex protein DDB_G0274915 [Drosophila ficusphila]|uniref:nuclear pore complex protein DDB_G0274915 n=1 Tax=Drosophila ficusphila TaxID=30025 RepID=UPI0007E8B565|nr:nuclear pore complex protein DDB_G0274915 [Drosophila ficusphila]